MEKIGITTEYIKLEQLLKLSGEAGSGGSAKAVILEGLVSVNGKVELQRGKKLRKGDIIEFESKKFQIE